jgi:hypothetical protein
LYFRVLWGCGVGVDGDELGAVVDAAADVEAMMLMLADADASEEAGLDRWLLMDGGVNDWFEKFPPREQDQLSRAGMN